MEMSYFALIASMRLEWSWGVTAGKDPASGRAVIGCDWAEVVDVPPAGEDADAFGSSRRIAPREKEEEAEAAARREEKAVVAVPRQGEEAVVVAPREGEEGAEANARREEEGVVAAPLEEEKKAEVPARGEEEKGEEADAAATLEEMERAVAAAPSEEEVAAPSIGVKRPMSELVSCVCSVSILLVGGGSLWRELTEKLSPQNRHIRLPVPFL